jgi:hypothetical protein
MRWLVVLLLALACDAFGQETFSFEMPEPRLRIVVPDAPQMKMGVHPNAAAQPHARFFGSAGAYTLSVLVPTADAGMTARDCARSSARSITSRFGLDPRFVVARQVDEATFLMLFPYRVDALIQFKAFLLSGTQGTHCVEVHVSRTMERLPEKAMAEALARWFEGFRGAKVEPY